MVSRYKNFAAKISKFLPNNTISDAKAFKFCIFCHIFDDLRGLCTPKWPFFCRSPAGFHM